jgi:hypothetical protein
VVEERRTVKEDALAEAEDETNNRKQQTKRS